MDEIIPTANSVREYMKPELVKARLVNRRIKKAAEIGMYECSSTLTTAQENMLRQKGFTVTKKCDEEVVSTIGWFDAKAEQERLEMMVANVNDMAVRERKIARAAISRISKEWRNPHETILCGNTVSMGDSPPTAADFHREIYRK